MKPIEVKVGSPVQHRAWHWFGKIIELPEDPMHTSVVVVELPDGTKHSCGIFALIYDENEFLYDWSEFDETPKGRSKGKSKKPKHKR